MIKSNVTSQLPIISIIWSTNAGKSSLFNRLIGNYRAIITDVSGTTRDWLQDEFHIHKNRYAVIDSPGLEQDKNNLWQITDLIDKSTVILFVVNSKTWRTSLDDNIYNMINKAGKRKNTILVINKLDLDKYIDVEEHDLAISEYMVHGFDIIIWVSTKNWLNLEEMEEEIHGLAQKISGKRDPSPLEKNFDKDIVRFAIVGKPNNGKSTMINRFAKEYISKVWEEPGTTLDYITTEVNHEGTEYMIYDTAWVRKRSKYKDIESIAHAKTFAMLEFVKPIAVLVIDWSQGITNQDHSVLDDVVQLKLPLVIAINKMDLLDEWQKKSLRSDMDKILNRLTWVEKIYISAKNNSNLNKVLDKVKDLHAKIANSHIPTPELNRYMQNAFLSNPPKFSKNKICKYYYVTQLPNTNPPKFVFFINDVDKANTMFTRRLENTIRKWFDFTWLPIAIEYKDRDGERKRE